MDRKSKEDRRKERGRSGWKRTGSKKGEEERRKTWKRRWKENGKNVRLGKKKGRGDSRDKRGRND